MIKLKLGGKQEIESTCYGVSVLRSSELLRTMFTAHDIKTLKNEVNAKILGIPFPFLGVDNTNACPQIYLADGTTKVNCPLKAGTEYVYKNSFNVLEIYPKVRISNKNFSNDAPLNYV